LKACRLFTGAGQKRNRFIERNSVSTTAYASIFILVRWHRATLVVPSAQFIHQMLEMGRQTRGLRTKVLLQPFAHGVADRSAGLAIDLFAVVVDSAFHGRFRFLVVSKNQVFGMGIVSRYSPIACILVKVE
jgi:hypothetical protein